MSFLHNAVIHVNENLTLVSLYNNILNTAIIMPQHGFARSIQSVNAA